MPSRRNSPRPSHSRRPTSLTRNNTAALGDILYTDYIYFFQIAGLILLVAMIGAIVLTLRHKEGVKRQDISAQVRAHAGDGDRNQESRNGQGHLTMQVGIAHFLTVSAILFTLGVFGIFLNRKNVIVILMSVELILLGGQHQFRGVLGGSRRPRRPGVRAVRAHRGGG